MDTAPAAPATPAPAKAEAPAPATAPAKGKGPVPAAPATRRLARELGVDINLAQPTGPGGRVTPEDVHRLASGFPRHDESHVRHVVAVHLGIVHREDPRFAVPIEAGRHTIQFSYRPVTFKWGVWISGITLLALLTGGGLIFRKNHNQRI